MDERPEDGDPAEEMRGILDRPERPRTDVAERVELQADREAIRTLIVKYGLYSDTRSWPQLVDLYTEDMVRVLDGTLHETVHGRDALATMLASGGTQGSPEQIARRARAARFTMRHHIDTEVIRISDDSTEAEAVALGTVVAMARDDHRQGSHEDIYFFRFRKQADGWRIAWQRVVTDNASNPVLHRD
jgi:ketosteroid isomerase-like protein